MYRARRPRFRCLLAALMGGMLLGGCASMRSLTDYQPGDPVWFAGTRLDVAAIRGDTLTLAKFTARPPRYPLLDLPFSFSADLLFWLIPRTPSPPPGAPGSER